MDIIFTDQPDILILVAIPQFTVSFAKELVVG